MSKSQDEYTLCCEFEPCGKALRHLCFVSEENNKYYCDEICCLRDLQECTPPPTMVQ